MERLIPAFHAGPHPDRPGAGRHAEIHAPSGETPELAR